MISFIQLIDKIKAFAECHEQIKRFGSDFEEQLPNFATEDESFPIVFLVPISKTPLENTNIFTVDIYCYDLIQKGRENIMTCYSDTDLILTDIFRFIKYGSDYSYDVLNTPNITPINNGILDYAVGNVLRLDIEIGTYCPDVIPTSC